MNYIEWAQEYEAEARRLADKAKAIRHKAKTAATYSYRGELRMLANRYESISREKLSEAGILRGRATSDDYEFVNRDI